MLAEPLLKDGLRLVQGRAHGRAATRGRLDPDREPHSLLGETTGAVRNLLRAVFESRRVLANVADRDHAASSQ